jgi:hypothetical protein
LRNSYPAEQSHAAVHVQANYAWQGLATYEREGIERVSAFQSMANFGAEVPLPLFTKAPKYLAESEARRAFSAGVLAGHNHMAEHGLDGMREAAYLGVDFCIPGGIDFGIAYANGEITRSQFVAYQSAAIAAEAATGYVAGKAVKGVARTIQRVARLTKELKTVKGIRAKSAGVLGRTHVEREATFLQQMGTKVNRHGAEAKAATVAQTAGHGEVKLSDVLNRDPKTGKITSVEGAQIHHVVSNKNPLTREHDLWELAGMNPNDRINKMVLPDKDGAKSLWASTKRSIHSGGHVKPVRTHLEKKMDAAQRHRQVNVFTRISVFPSVFRYKESVMWPQAIFLALP